MTLGTNYAANPSFEGNNSTGWAWTGLTAVTLANGQPPPGAGQFALLCTSNGSANPRVVGQATNLTVGNRYCASVYVRMDASLSGANPLTAFGYCNETGQLGTRVTQFGRWFRVRVTITATATTHNFGVQISGTPASGGTFAVDRLVVNDGELPYPYFDGNHPGGAWAGTTNNSNSTCSYFASYTADDSMDGNATVLDGLLLQTVAWNLVSRTGRVQIPSVRGSNLQLPGQSGKQFIAGKPVDSAVYTLTMFILGSLNDGTVPRLGGHAEVVFQENLARIMRAAADHTTVTPIVAWQADGTVRTVSADLAGSTDIAQMMGGARGELALAFELMDSWQDALLSTTVGVAGTHWTNDTMLLPGLAGMTAPIEDAVFTVQGPIQNPVISTPFGAVSWTGTLTSAQQWVVDSGAFTSVAAGASALAATAHTRPRFGTITPESGNATAPAVGLSGTGTGASTNLTVAARRRHYGG